MHSRIHIFGASGSGTTTLGSALGDELGIPHLDADTYYWRRTDPPFIEKNPPNQRVEMIRFDTRNVDSWVLSGSICSWGDKLLGDITHAVFLYIDALTRLHRLYDRELERHGNRIEAGGDMHQQHIEFIAWAESYDTARHPFAVSTFMSRGSRT